jgi:hypothetical protein
MQRLRSTLGTVLAAATALTSACAAEIEGEDEDSTVTERALFASSRTIWPSGSIPVCWLNPTNENQFGRDLTRAAVLETWAAAAPLNFTGWGPCESWNVPGIRIFVEDSQPRSRFGANATTAGNWSMILNFTFKNWGETCRLNLDSCIRGLAAHEFGHALGFDHEQNRPDNPGHCAKDTVGYGNLTLGAYDPNSVMNYCAPVSNNGGKLSAGDIAGVRAVYGDHCGGLPCLHAMESDILLRWPNPNAPGGVSLSVGVSDGVGRFAAPGTGDWSPGWGPTTEPVYVGDFNGDGRSDIFLRWPNSRVSSGVSFTVGLSDGVGRFAAPGTGDWNPGFGPTTEPVYVGDFNGDGRSDVLLRFLNSKAPSGVSYTVGISNGAGRFWAPGSGDWNQHGFGPTTEPVYVGDFNGDNRSDILLRQPSPQGNGAWKYYVALAAYELKFAPATDWNTNSMSGTRDPVYVGDFNGDGRSDILLRWPNPGATSGTGWSYHVGISNGYSSFNAPGTGDWNPSFGNTTDPVFVGDFNRDGKSDVLLRWPNPSAAGGSGWSYTVGISTGAGRFAGAGTGDWNPYFGTTSEPVYVGAFTGRRR